MNEVAVGALLEALSLSRSRRFCMMVEDECANLVRCYRLSRGLVHRLEFPPLSESLRDHISATAARFGLKSRTLPEGDNEKSMEIICSGACREPALRYRDFIPCKCPLESLSQEERRRMQLENMHSEEASKGGGRGSTALVDGGGANAQAPAECTTARRRISGEGPGGEEAAEFAGSADKNGRVDVDVPEHDSIRQGAAAAGSSDEVGKPSKRARRPAMAVYRPRAAREEREARQASIACRKDAHSLGSTSQSHASERTQVQSGDGMQVDPVDRSEVALKQNSECEPGGQHWGGQKLAIGGSSDECPALYKYEGFQIDPTPRPWDQPRKRAFVDLSPGGRWHRDITWQLKGNDNGFFCFTAQVRL